ncbi:hypothetical protein BX616_010433 [Lobosporangium transversale]|nr:hypothetical protein BX616_010433 [Lobosporangium transversale]
MNVENICKSDHVFCEACLEVYIDDYLQSNQLKVLQETDQEQQSQSHLSRPIQHPMITTSDQEAQEEEHEEEREEEEKERPIESPSSLNDTISVECPECRRTAQDSASRIKLCISSFRPAKYLARMIDAQRLRCPTTMMRSCQWIGAMKDMHTHLDVCGFAIETLCPHRQYGCRYRASALDIVAHLPSCPFAPQGSSTSEISDSQSLPETSLPNQHIAPLSPPQSSPPMNPMDYPPHGLFERFPQTQESDNIPDQQQDSDKKKAMSSTANELQPSNKNFRALSMDSITEDGPGHINDLHNGETVRMDDNEDEFDQDEFLERLEDLEMADISFSPHHSPLLAHSDNSPDPLLIKSEQAPISMSLQPLRVPTRRRLIVEEESEQEDCDNATRAAVNDHNLDVAMTDSVPPTEMEDRSQYGAHAGGDPNDQGLLPYISSYAGELPPASRSAALHQSSPHIDGLTSTSDHPAPLITEQQLPPAPLSPHQIEQEAEQHNPQTFITRRRPSLDSLTDAQHDSSKRRMLEFHGPWQWQVGPASQAQPQEPAIITMTDISSVDSPAASSVMSSLVSSFIKPLSRRPASFFAPLHRPMTRSEATDIQVYVAESSSYLPLLVHQPRYLRPRQKKILRGRARSKFLTPIVHGTNNTENQLNGPPFGSMMTNITSPENSFASDGNSHEC